jgi:2-iminobutanoate/2-iminopropanoate deaminase
MTKKAIKASNAPQPVARYSQAIRVGNTLYMQGVIALDPQTGKMIAGNIEAQTKRVFEGIEAVLTEAGMRLADVVKVSAFLADMADYPKFNAIYNQKFSADPPPVRTTVQVGLPFGALVEVDVIAAV